MIEHKPGDIYVDKEGGKHKCMNGNTAKNTHNPCHECSLLFSTECTQERNDLCVKNDVYYERVEE